MALSKPRILDERAGRSPQARRPRPPLHVIEAPSNLGLKPLSEGHIPGAWRAPEALRGAGLADMLGAVGTVMLARPVYVVEGEAGTRIRNARAIRTFSLELAARIEETLDAGGFPLVVGGDCSILLGCLLACRRSGGRGLVHVDGHSDFFHPGNYDTASRLGSVAGMDLALATGRGEPVLTDWPGLAGPLVDDRDVVQFGERDSQSAEWPQAYSDIEDTQITRVTIQDIRAGGLAKALDVVTARLSERGLDRCWLHVDLDVLDESVMSAVDSPGSPGLDFAELAMVMKTLLDTGVIQGADITIYDPDLDPKGRFAAPICRALAAAFA